MVASAPPCARPWVDDAISSLGRVPRPLPTLPSRSLGAPNGGGGGGGGPAALGVVIWFTNGLRSSGVQTW